MLVGFWASRCYFSEGRAWLEKGLALVDQEDLRRTGLLARAFSAAGYLANEQYDLSSAYGYFKKSESFCRTNGDQETLSDVLTNLAKLIYFSGDQTAAHSLIDEAELICRESGNGRGLAMVLTVKGGLFCWREQNYAEALACTEESIRLFLKSGDRWEAEANYSQMGWILLQTGDYEGARAYTEKAMRSYRELGDRAALAYATEIMGDIAHMQMDYESMVSFFQETLALRGSLGHEGWVVNMLYWLGLGWVEMGETQKGAEVLAERLARLRARGRDFSILDDLVGWAGIVLSSGEAERGVAMLAAFKALHPRQINWRDANEKAFYERALAKVQALLSPADFSAAWARGNVMSSEQAIREVFNAASQFVASP
jgi:tetratricopeptide (TPR) repeat protein